jgi:pimeloyl-ACP methyl ester carboxylesterase
MWGWGERMEITLHYHECGAGAPLILLHGNGESTAYFQHQMEPFAARFRVIAVDTRGHGQSPRGDMPFTLAQFAEDLKQFLDAMGIQKAHILGFSDGANIALLFALKYPQFVDKLILDGADLSPRGVKASVQIPICIGYGLVSLIARFDRAAIAKKELLGLMVTQPDIAPDALAALTMPVLVLAGTRDMIKDAHTRLIAASIPNAQLRILDGDHFIAAKNSAAFNEAVLEFL